MKVGSQQIFETMTSYSTPQITLYPNNHLSDLINIFLYITLL